MGHRRRDVVDVVGDHDQRRRGRVASEVVEAVHELLAATEVEPAPTARRAARQRDRSSTCGRGARADVLPTTATRRARSAKRPTPMRSRHMTRALVVGGGVAVPPRFERREAGRAHDVEHAQRRTQLVGEGGRQVADASAQLTHVGAPEPLAEHLDGAVGRMVVEGGHPQQRRLAAAVGAEHQPPLARAGRGT